jgi:hypothetical protein
MGTFKELHIGFVDDGRKIAILPMLLPDVVEQHGDPDDAVIIVNTEDRAGHDGLAGPAAHAVYHHGA